MYNKKNKKQLKKADKKACFCRDLKKPLPETWVMSVCLSADKMTVFVWRAARVSATETLIALELHRGTVWRAEVVAGVQAEVTCLSITLSHCSSSISCRGTFVFHWQLVCERQAQWRQIAIDFKSELPIDSAGVKLALWVIHPLQRRSFEYNLLV